MNKLEIKSKVSKIAHKARPAEVDILRVLFKMPWSDRYNILSSAFWSGSENLAVGIPMTVIMGLTGWQASLINAFWFIMGARKNLRRRCSEWWDKKVDRRKSA